MVGGEDFVGGRPKTVSGIETPDPGTIAFHLTSADPIFVQKLAMPFAAALPHEVADQWGDDFSRHVVGSGPFMLKEWRSGERIVLVRNPRYFDRKLPPLDPIVEAIRAVQELP